MNYDYINQIHDYWMSDIFPHLVHRYTTVSFEDYLRRISFLPSCKWIRKMEKVKIARVPFAVIPHDFVKKYKDCCVTYNAPTKPDEGLQRIIYQFSPTLHLEASLWIWIENKILQSYVMMTVCYHEEKEYLAFIDDLYTIRREGNTEDKMNLTGFMVSQPVDIHSDMSAKKELTIA